MSKILILGTALALMTSTVAARAVQPDADFRSIVPRGWTLQAPDPKSNLRRFVSPQRDAWLVLYAEPADRESVGAHMAAVKAVEGGRITYERAEPGWVVVSGFRGSRIFYRKAMLACGGRRWHQIEFDYPAEQKLAFDRFVTRAAYALQAYAAVGCS